MKFTKRTFKLLKSANGTIQCWSNDGKLFETEIDGKPEPLENMKFFIGGQTNFPITNLTPKAVIRNVRIEEQVCFFVKSCANENDPGCNNQFRGNEILVLRNMEVVSKIESGFHVFDECFATTKNATFEFHAGGTDGVSFITQKTHKF